MGIGGGAIRLLQFRLLEETRSARRSLPTMTWLGLLGAEGGSECWVGIDRRAIRGLWGDPAGGNAEWSEPDWHAVTPYHDVACLLGAEGRSECWVGIDRRAIRWFVGAPRGGNAECPAVTPHLDVAWSCGC